MKIILDFDRTLFNVDAYFSKVLKSEHAALSLSPDIWKIFNAESFLYDDVYTFIKKYKKEELAILTSTIRSHGENVSEYQKEKVQSSGVVDLVGEIVYTQNNKGPFVARMAVKPHTIFVDDTLAHLESAQMHYPNVISMHMVRNGYKNASFPSKMANYVTVHSLSEVSDMIEKL